MLTQWYNRVCVKAVSEQKLEEFNNFLRQGLENGLNEPINSELHFLNYNIEDAGNNFLDFIEIEENTHLYAKDEYVSESGDTIIHWMGTLSISLRQFDVIKRATEVRNSFKSAHRASGNFLQNLVEVTDETNFRDILRK